MTKRFFWSTGSMIAGLALAIAPAHAQISDDVVKSVSSMTHLGRTRIFPERDPS